MSSDDFDAPSRPPKAADRKEVARQRAAELAETRGELQPAAAKGTRIATTFWGQAWNRNLEQYEYYEHRLPSGRSYLRNGQVLDLRVSTGRIDALVSGTELYEVTIQIRPLDPERWSELRKTCSGKIDSVIGLLQGDLTDSVMEAVTARDTGLFPRPEEIRFVCNCPDYADLCKHSAAVAYGTGARLDEQPALLFLLRGVDHAELIDSANESLAAGVPAAEDIGDLGEIFGIDLEGPIASRDPKNYKEQK